MNVRFLSFYRSNGKEYIRHHLYPAKAVTDDGSGLVDIEFMDGDMLLGVKSADVEIYDGAVTQVKPSTAGCCNKKKGKKDAK